MSSGIFSSFKITTSALTAQRLRMDVISSNIANAETTRTVDGGPYQRKQVFFMPEQSYDSIADRLNTFRTKELDEPGQGVTVASILEDDAPGNMIYDPQHPDADEDGFVEYPNVNVVTEMTDMLSATRSYEANVTVFNALKGMVQQALEIGKA